MAEHNDLGKYGEKLACDYLIDKGYIIVSKNYRYGKGEIDIIATNAAGKYVFFEVKTRKGGGEPEQAVNAKKVRLLLETMEQFKFKYSIEDETFFDIIAIVVNDNHTYEISHFEDVWAY